MGKGSEKSNSDSVWALAIHGGADPHPKDDHNRSEKHIRELLKSGAKMLKAGASAVETVHEMVRELEACGLHVAGKGAAPNLAGRWELDAAIMDGETRNAGAVAALQSIKHPIDAAVAVMEHTPHVLLAGEGAMMFARAHKLKRIKDPKSYYEPAKSALEAKSELAHGTVGAVALDMDGLLASATSTGGVLKKIPGRVGDTPLIGAGTWADERVAVSCTGIGEYFIRTNAASDVSARIRHGRESVEAAASGVIEDIGFLGGQGGMIAIDCLGRVAMPFNTQGMKRGFIHSNGKSRLATF